MSTVLWTHYLADGVVTSDDSDKYALYKYLDKLDAICRVKGLPLLSSLCDSTDLKINLEQIELPAGMESTTQLMAQQGVWLDSGEALHLLETLLTTIREQNTRFGLFKNCHDDVVAELEESIAFAKTACEIRAKFNFAIIM